MLPRTFWLVSTVLLGLATCWPIGAVGRAERLVDRVVAGAADPAEGAADLGRAAWLADRLVAPDGGSPAWPTWYPARGLGEALGGTTWRAAAHPLSLPRLVAAEDPWFGHAAVLWCRAGFAVVGAALAAWAAGAVRGPRTWEVAVLAGLGWGLAPSVLANLARDDMDGVFCLPLVFAAAAAAVRAAGPAAGVTGVGVAAASALAAAGGGPCAAVAAVGVAVAAAGSLRPRDRRSITRASLAGWAGAGCLAVAPSWWGRVPAGLWDLGVDAAAPPLGVWVVVMIVQARKPGGGGGRTLVGLWLLLRLAATAAPSGVAGGVCFALDALLVAGAVRVVARRPWDRSAAEASFDVALPWGRGSELGAGLEARLPRAALGAVLVGAALQSPFGPFGSFERTVHGPVPATLPSAMPETGRVRRTWLAPDVVQPPHVWNARPTRRSPVAASTWIYNQVGGERATGPFAPPVRLLGLGDDVPLARIGPGGAGSGGVVARLGRDGVLQVLAQQPDAAVPVVLAFARLPGMEVVGAASRAVSAVSDPPAAGVFAEVSAATRPGRRERFEVRVREDASGLAPWFALAGVVALGLSASRAAAAESAAPPR